MYERVVEIGLLFDFYGKLLSEKQYSIVELYYIHDLSLREVAEQLNISRQGVYDMLKRSENHLYEFENKLGLVGKFEANRTKIETVLNEIDYIINEAGLLNLDNIKLHADRIRNITRDILEISQEGK